MEPFDLGHRGTGAELKAKGRQPVPPGECLILELPGGGYGDPKERDPGAVAIDVRDGLVSRAAARSEYGVVLNDEGAVDGVATAMTRGTGGGPTTAEALDRLRTG